MKIIDLLPDEQSEEEFKFDEKQETTVPGVTTSRSRGSVLSQSEVTIQDIQLDILDKIPENTERPLKYKVEKIEINQGHPHFKIKVPNTKNIRRRTETMKKFRDLLQM